MYEQTNGWGSGKWSYLTHPAPILRCAYVISLVFWAISSLQSHSTQWLHSFSIHVLAKPESTSNSTSNLKTWYFLTRILRYGKTENVIKASVQTYDSLDFWKLELNGALRPPLTAINLPAHICAGYIYRISVIGYLPDCWLRAPGFNSLLLRWLNDLVKRTRVRKLMDSPSIWRTARP